MRLLENCPALVVILLIFTLVWAPTRTWASDQGCKPAPTQLGVPLEIVAAAASPSLVDALSFSVTNSKVSGSTVTADLSVSLIGHAASCSIAPRFPIGLTLRDASFSLANTDDVQMQPFGNISFVADQFGASLDGILPLPAGFEYRARLETAPIGFDGTTVPVDVVAPAGLGVILSGEWVIDRTQPDLGLRAFAAELGVDGKQLEAAGRQAADNFKNAMRAKIDEFLAAKSIPIGMAEASQLSVDWGAWDQGVHAFKVGKLDWTSIDLDVAQLLPASAAVSLDANNKPHLVVPPLDNDALRQFLGREVLAAVGDSDALNAIMAQFGDPNFKSLPLGWLRVRNAALTGKTYSAEVAFAIGGEQIKWVPVKADLPLRKTEFQEIVHQLGVDAAESIKDFATKMVAGTAFAKVSKFVQEHGTQQLFGLTLQIALKSPPGNELPIGPIVKLTDAADGVTIDNVGLTIQNDKANFDWSAAHLTGADALAAKILAASGLSGGDLSLSIRNVELDQGAVTGEVSGNILGTPFAAKFKINQNDRTISLPDIHADLIASLQSALAGQQVSFSGLMISDVQLCPEGVDRGVCNGNSFGASAKFSAVDLFSGTVELSVFPKLKLTNIAINTYDGLMAAANLLEDAPIIFQLPPPQLSPLVITGTIKLSQVKLFGLDEIPLPDVNFSWSSESGKLTLLGASVITFRTDIFIPPWLNLADVTFPIGKAPDGTVTVGAKMTIGERYVSYIFSIAGQLQGNPKNHQLKLSGDAALLSTPLYTVDGTLDFDKKDMFADAKTAGFLKAIIPQQSMMHASGVECLVREQDTVHFIFLDMKDDLLIQVPPGACDHPLSPAASQCGLTSAGGVCISAHVDTKLGGAQAHLSAGLSNTLEQDLAASMTSELHVGVDVELGVGLTLQELAIKARATVLSQGIKFGLVIARPDGSSDASGRDIIAKIIEALLHLKKLDFSKPISLSVESDGDKGDVTIEKDDGKDPKMSQLQPKHRDNPPCATSAAGCQTPPPAPCPTPGAAGCPPTPPPPCPTPGAAGCPPTPPPPCPTPGAAGCPPTPPPPCPTPGAAGCPPTPPPPCPTPGAAGCPPTPPPPCPTPGAAGCPPTPPPPCPAQGTGGCPTPLRPGPISVVPEPDNRITEKNTSTGSSHTSSQPADASAIEILNGACTLEWFRGDSGGTADAGASYADAVVISSLPSCQVKICPAGQICVLGLRNHGANAGALPLAGKMDWPAATAMLTNPGKASDLELGLIRAIAGAKLFPPESGKVGVDPNASWRCALLDKSAVGCRVAVEETTDGKHPLIANEAGEIFPLDDNSLLAWAAGANDVKNKVYSAMADSTLAG
jgi:hypothetical protein